MRLVGIGLDCLSVALMAYSGGSDSLDMKKVQDSIKSSLEKDNQVRVDSVACQDKRAIKANDTFECTPTVGSQQLKLQLQQDDDKGNISWTSQQAILNIGKLVSTIETSY